MYERQITSDMTTTLQEGEAKVIQLKSTKQFSPKHSLDLLILKTTIFRGCEFSSKLLPLVVRMIEDKSEEKLTDVYSFDNNGTCLSHGYSRYRDGKAVVDEQHDTDISRLIEHGKSIKEMIGEYYPIPTPLVIHTTFLDLRENCLNR